MSREKRNWSDLPSELIHLIAKKLPDLLDFIRFRAVCATWRSSAPLSDPPHQLPWLLELSDQIYAGFYTLRERQRYYSVSLGQTLTIPFVNTAPPLRTWIIDGVCNSHLAFCEYYGKILSFYNPLTKDQFSLPPMRFGLVAPWMVWTGTDPIHTRSIVVVDRDVYPPYIIGGWAFYDPQRNQWVENEGYFYSSCYWQGMIFATLISDELPDEWVEVFDAYSKELLHTIPQPDNEWMSSFDSPQHFKHSYLIVSSGVILKVSWFYDWQRKTVEESVFHIYRLDYETADGEPCWVPISDIGDQILFLDKMNGFSMTARPSSGYREGCIYFINFTEHKPYMYDIMAGTFERVPCPFDRCTWFVPSL